MSCDYSYSKYINPPVALGISDKGTLKALGNDINGIIAYTDVLINGTGKASATGKPLGNKYFMNASSKCKDSNGKEQDRYIYINNVPQGDLGIGRGLLPGLVESVGKLDPSSIMTAAFESTSTPKCEKITLETIDCANKSKNETHYVAVTDIKNEKLKDLGKSKEQFQGMSSPKMPRDTMSQIYFAGLASLGIILFYKLMVNRVRDR